MMSGKIDEQQFDIGIQMLVTKKKKKKWADVIGIEEGVYGNVYIYCTFMCSALIPH